MPSKSANFTPAFASAASMIGKIFLMCWRDASSGTTPP
jgi:hypothetical protein